MNRTGLAVLLVALLAGCTPAPEGTRFWQQVQREYASQDYIDTLNYIADVLRTENEFNERAAVLKTTILGGMARAAFEISEACAEGIDKVADWDSKPYKACIDQYRSQTRANTLALIDALAEFEQVAAESETLTLDFPLSEARETPSPIVGRTRAGAMPAEKMFEPAVVRIMSRQVALQASDVVGASDLAAAKTMFESPPVTVSKSMFLVGVAKTLLTTAALFEQDRIDDSEKRAAVLKRARDCLTPALEGDDAEAKSRARTVSREIAAALRR